MVTLSPEQMAANDLVDAILADGRSLSEIPQAEIDDCADQAMAHHGIVRTSRSFVRVLTMASKELQRRKTKAGAERQ